jgi:plastocyanin
VSAGYVGNSSAASGSTTLTVTPGPAIQLSLSPGQSTIVAGGSQTYTAQGVDSYGNATGDVTAATSFTFNGAGSCSGAICTSSQQGSYSVSGVDGGLQGLANLSVNSASIDHLALSPASVTITAGDSVAYTVMAYDHYGNYAGPGNVSSLAVISIAPDGSCQNATCTVTKAGSHTVTATYDGKSVAGSLTVNPGFAATVTLSPATATIAAGGTQGYAAQAADRFGNSLGDVTGGTTFWVDTPSTPCSASVCSATTSGNHHVIGQFQSVQGTAVLMVNPGPATSLTVSPTSLAIPVGQSANLSATAADAYGNAVSTTSVAWSVTAGTPGTVSPATGNFVLFTASATKSAFGKVVAQLGSVTASVSVSVAPAPPINLRASVNGHKVSLSWSASAGAATYTIYRSSGSSYTPVRSGVTATSFTDSNVPAGTYTYYATAWSTPGIESTGSNKVTATVK